MLTQTLQLGVEREVFDGRRPSNRVFNARPDPPDPEGHSRKKRGGGSGIFRIESNPPIKLKPTDSTGKGALHKKDDLDRLLVTFHNLYSRKNPDGDAFKWLADYARANEDGSLALVKWIEQQCPKARHVLGRQPFVGYDEPQAGEYAAQIVSLVWKEERSLQRRDKDCAEALISYIEHANIVEIDEDYAGGLVRGALNGEETYFGSSVRSELTKWSFSLKQLFSRDAIEEVVKQASRDNEESARWTAIEVMHQLVYAGSVHALEPDILITFLESIEDLAITNINHGMAETLTFFADTPLNILRDAIENRDDLRHDSRITGYFERYVAKITPLISGSKQMIRHSIERVKDSLGDETK